MKKIMTRIAACSLAVLIAFNTALVPRSKAVGAEVVGTAALATSTLAAYMTATGVPLTVTAGGAAAASAGAASLISGYAAATGGTYSVVTTALASGVTIGTGGAIIIGAAAAALLAGIVAWAINEYGVTEDNSTSVYTSASNGFWYGDGTEFFEFSEIVYTSGESYVIPGSKLYGLEYSEEIYLQNDNVYQKYINCSMGYVGMDYVPQGFGHLIWKDSASTQKLYDLSALYKPYLIRDLANSQWIFTKLTQDNAGYYRLYEPKYCSFSEYPWIEEFFNVSPVDVSVGLDAGYEAPPVVEEQYAMVIDTGMTIADEQSFIDAVLGGVASGSFAPTYTIEIATGGDVVVPDEDTDTQAGILGWVKAIAQRVSALPQSIAEAVKSVFVPDAALTTEITDTFSEKFAFVPQLHALGTDLLNMGPDSGPPVIYIHLEDAEGTIDYGGTIKALDMSWYERYKEDGDRIIGGFLWLGFLWALFMRVSDIINGAGMAYVLGQPTIYTPEPPNDAPRLEGSRKRGKR